ncbi:MAG TPA: YceH family protein [Phycisphaerales bacterium]|nr:YceH family protein [Phycisphaerales bacterium]
MIALTPNECRVLGVLIEKAQTTPGQYPLTLNGMVNGANQKQNRDPVMNLDEERVQDAVDGLRSKGLAREVILTGSRVDKYRHVTRDVLKVNDAQVVILAELLLRGPQTVGEIRGRASRMHPLDSTEMVARELEEMRDRTEPLVKDLPPMPGDRAARYMQLLCPNLHDVNAVRRSETSEDPGHVVISGGRADGFAERIDKLEGEVEMLRSEVAKLKEALGG